MLIFFSFSPQSILPCRVEVDTVSVDVECKACTLWLNFCQTRSVGPTSLTLLLVGSPVFCTPAQLIAVQYNHLVKWMERFAGLVSELSPCLRCLTADDRSCMLPCLCVWVWSFVLLVPLNFVAKLLLHVLRITSWNKHSFFFWFTKA